MNNKNNSRNYGLAWNKIGEAIDYLEEVQPKPSKIISQLESIAEQLYEERISLQEDVDIEIDR